MSPFLILTCCHSAYSLHILLLGPRTAPPSSHYHPSPAGTLTHSSWLPRRTWKEPACCSSLLFQVWGTSSV